MNLGIFKTYNDLAINTYHVDPKIFVALVLISVPFYWYGWLMIVRSIFKSKSKEGNNGRIIIERFFNNREFKIGLIINRLAWFLPYVYIIFWGQNLPMWFWLMLSIWIIFFICLFTLKIRRIIITPDGGRKQYRYLWKIYAYFYDGLLIFKPYQSLIELILEKADLKKGESVVDLGCGTGNIEKMTQVGGVDFYGLDFSDEMLKRAERKCPDYKFINYNLTDYNIPLESNFADKVISNNVIYNIKDIEKFCKDVNRIMKPGGILILSTSIKSGLKPIAIEHFKLSKPIDLLKSVIFLPKFLIILILNIFIDRSGDFYFYSEERLQKVLRESGFNIREKIYCYGDVNLLITAEAL